MSESEMMNEIREDIESGKRIERYKEPLPATYEDMLARRTVRPTSFNDRVDEAHKWLYRNSQEYRDLLDPVDNDDASTGHLALEDGKAAELVKAWAAENNRDPEIASKKLYRIVKALRVAWRRYHLSRSERAMMIGDKVYPETIPTVDDTEGN